MRVRGDQLVPRDGHYELRAQANLWETHYFDHLALHVIDHPPGTELYVDERFALEPAEPMSVLTGPARPVSAAKDHHGADATAVVRAVAPKPVNVLVGADFTTVEDLASLGVRRISVGGALARAAWTGFVQAAEEIADHGTFSRLGQALPFGEVNAWFPRE